jgi:DUF917 family protein
MGALLLGSGGGGDVSLGVQLLRQQLRNGLGIPVIDADSLPPARTVIHPALIGSPTVNSERLMHPDDFVKATSALASHLGVQVSAVGIAEIGGVNAFTPMMVAAALGLPLIDGDLIGRAFPRPEQTTLAFAGEPIGPLSVIGPHGETVLISGADVASVQRLLWSAVAAMGGAAASALYPIEAGRLASHGLRGSLSTCHRIGRQFLAAPATSGPELAQAVGGRLLCEGRVDELRPAGQDLGCATLGDRRTGAVVRVDFRSEFVNVAIDGCSVASTPDVIVALDPARRRPLFCEELRPGQPLVIVCIRALYDWPEKAMSLVGPAAFGAEGAAEYPAAP